MNGDDLERRVGRQRAEARTQSKLGLLWRGAREGKQANGADCAKQAHDPTRRLEPLRRRTRDIQGSQQAD